MEMERKRGVSIASAVLQFGNRICVINLLATSGHGDFSEDTYRVLAAVDAAVMLLDAAKGLQPQTLKLFDVCRARGIPVLTFVNKWDRPGREPLELLDEVAQAIGLRPTPVTWPVGLAGDLRRLVDCTTGHFTRYHRTAGGATRAETEPVPTERAAVEEARYWPRVQEELALLREIGAQYDEKQFLAGVATPVLYGAALPTIGVERLLDALVNLGPAPHARADAQGRPRALDAPLSGIVCKGAGGNGSRASGSDGVPEDLLGPVRARDGAHPRAQSACVRHQVRTVGVRPAAVDAAGGVPGRHRGPGQRHCAASGRHALRRGPGGVPGDPEVRPRALRRRAQRRPGPGQTVPAGNRAARRRGRLPGAAVGPAGRSRPVLAAVGPLQFEVATARLESEFRVPVTLEPVRYSLAGRTNAAGAALLDAQSEVEVLTRRADDALLAVFATTWRLDVVRRKFPDLVLDPLPGQSIER
jgi:peptide chain release factor 3